MQSASFEFRRHGHVRVGGVFNRDECAVLEARARAMLGGEFVSGRLPGVLRRGPTGQVVLLEGGREADHAYGDVLTGAGLEALAAEVAGCGNAQLVQDWLATDSAAVLEAIHTAAAPMALLLVPVVAARSSDCGALGIHRGGMLSAAELPTGQPRIVIALATDGGG